MYDDFDSFFEAFRKKISAMDNKEFLRFLGIPEDTLMKKEFKEEKK